MSRMLFRAVLIALLLAGLLLLIRPPERSGEPRAARPWVDLGRWVAAADP